MKKTVLLQFFPIQKNYFNKLHVNFAYLDSVESNGKNDITQQLQHQTRRVQKMNMCSFCIYA